MGYRLIFCWWIRVALQIDVRGNAIRSASEGVPR